MPRLPPVAGDQPQPCWYCRSGWSARPSNRQGSARSVSARSVSARSTDPAGLQGSPGQEVGSRSRSATLSRPGRAGSHGAAAAGAPHCLAASRTASTTRARSSAVAGGSTCGDRAGCAAASPGRGRSTAGPSTVTDGPQDDDGSACRRAVWNTTGGSEPERATARPGAVGSRSAAVGTSTTSSDSARSLTRSAIRRLTFARRSAESAPAGRWVASTRWIPSERPTVATRTSPGRNPGNSSASTRNVADCVARSTAASRRSDPLPNRTLAHR